MPHHHFSPPLHLPKRMFLRAVLFVILFWYGRGVSNQREENRFSINATSSTDNNNAAEKPMSNSTINVSYCLQGDPICQSVLDDEKTHVLTFYTSFEGSITACVSGSVSAVSSLLIIYFITKRSSVGLSSVYHRLMFGMSIADTISSVPIAFSSFLLPRDMIYDFENPWVFGNQRTCTLQGVFITFGLHVGLMYNAILAFYFLFSIRYKMKDDSMKKCIEPTMVALSIVLSLPLPIVSLHSELYNPTPYEAWCTITPLPWHCAPVFYPDGGMDECILRGKIGRIERAALGYYFAFVVLVLLVTILSMVLIIHSVYTQEKYIKAVGEAMYGIRRLGGARRSSDGPDASKRLLLALVKRRHKFTKVLCIQAAAYIFSFFICQLSSLVHFHRFQARTVKGWSIQIYHVISRPLQGFLYLLIFIGHKVDDARRIDPDLTTMQAIMKVLFEKEEQVILISSISLVRIHDEEKSNDNDDDGDDDDNNNNNNDDEGFADDYIVDDGNSGRYIFEGPASEGDIEVELNEDLEQEQVLSENSTSKELKRAEMQGRGQSANGRSLDGAGSSSVNHAGLTALQGISFNRPDPSPSDGARRSVNGDNPVSVEGSGNGDSGDEQNLVSMSTPFSGSWESIESFSRDPSSSRASDGFLSYADLSSNGTC